jgi:hypothetical protein
MLLQRAGLDKIVDAHRLPLAKPVQPPDALLDLHRIPRQIEVGEAMAELEVSPLRAAVCEQQRAGALAKLLGDRLLQTNSATFLT